MDISCRFAVPRDTAAVRRLWKEGFPTDTDADFSAFWDHIVPARECLLFCVDKTPVSLLFLLPVSFRTEESTGAVGYIYAVVTDRRFRGRGYAGRLLRFAEEEARTAGYHALCLCPAGESLFAYYARLGYEPYLYAYDRHSSQVEAGATVPDYARVRERLLNLRKIPHIVWPERLIAVVLSTATATTDGTTVYLTDGCVKEKLPFSREELSVVGMWKSLDLTGQRWQMSNREKQPYIGLALD